jgi:signal transduction histidine kinase
MAVSLFNTILMLWLGLTILLNTERRTWGVWLTGGGLLISGAFFVSHTAIFGYGLKAISRELDFWWRLGWLPVIILPFGWYLAMLWYSGFWANLEGDGARPLRRRHQPWLLLTTLLSLGLLVLLLLANPLPTYTQVTQLRLSATPTVANIPLMVLLYPAYIILCIVLSLDALRHPAPSERMMGEVARRRAWPWLMAASIILLLVSLLVGWIMVWIVLSARQRDLTGLYGSMTRAVTWFDLIISGLIAAAVICLGRAIVSYEVFTGRTLPRRGFFRHWRNVVILAAGYGIVAGGSLTFNLRPIYSILIITVSIAPFYALFSWRSYVERQRYIAQLRPFVSSQRLYDHLLSPTTELPDMNILLPFGALCADILGTRLAYLIPLGPLAPLVGPGLAYPNEKTELPDVTCLTAEFKSPQTMGMALDAARYRGAIWAVPLWSERGLIGVLLLGAKRERGLYTQEEVEIARATGERLIDSQASAEIARRLMSLQRRRLMQSQVLDQQTRRILHDDVLPNLHAAMLTLSGSGHNGAPVAALADAHRQIADLLHTLPTAIVPEVARLGLFEALRRVVEDELAGEFDEVAWQIDPAVEGQSRTISGLVAEVIFFAAREALRNAARHARRTSSQRPLCLKITATWEGGLGVFIEDNGAGINKRGRANGGSGQGLALHSTMMAIIGGNLEVASAPGAYTRVTLWLPEGGILADPSSS